MGSGTKYCRLKTTALQEPAIFAKREAFRSGPANSFQCDTLQFLLSVIVELDFMGYVAFIWMGWFW